MSVGSHRGGCLRRRKSPCFLRGEASLGWPCSTCRCRRSVVLNKTTYCRRSCVTLVLVTFPGPSAHIQSLPWLGPGQRFRLWLSAAGAAASFLVEAVLSLAQHLSGALLHVDAADRFDAQGLPLRVGQPQ